MEWRRLIDLHVSPESWVLTPSFQEQIVRLSYPFNDGCQSVIVAQSPPVYPVQLSNVRTFGIKQERDVYQLTPSLFPESGLAFRAIAASRKKPAQCRVLIEVTDPDPPPKIETTEITVSQMGNLTHDFTAVYPVGQAANHLVVYGPNNFIQYPELLGVVNSSEGLRVNYRVTAPLGGWGLASNGKYFIAPDLGKIGFFRVGITLHPDTQNWLSRVGLLGVSVPPNRIKAVDAAIRYAHTTGLKSKIRYLLCSVASGGFLGCNVPIWDDGVGNAILTNYGAGNWSSLGLDGDWATRFINTNWTPTSRLTGNGCIFQWTNGPAQSSVFRSLGCIQTSTSRMLIYWTSNFGGEVVASIFRDSSGGQVVRTGISLQGGLLLANQTGASHRLLLNNTLLASNSVSSVGTPPTISVYFHALNSSGSATGFYGDRLLFAGMGAGLTPTEESTLFTMLSDLKAGLGA